MSETKPVYQVLRLAYGWCEVPKDRYDDLITNGSREGRVLYQAEDYEALQANCIKLLDEQDREYSRKTNELIKRHVDQIEALQKKIAELRERIKKMEAEEKFREHMAKAKF